MFVRFNRVSNRIEVVDSARNRTEHVLPHIFRSVGGFAESLANEAMQNPGLPVAVPTKFIRRNGRVW
jgi:hypothetical protein